MKNKRYIYWPIICLIYIIVSKSIEFEYIKNNVLLLLFLTIIEFISYLTASVLIIIYSIELEKYITYKKIGQSQLLRYVETKNIEHLNFTVDYFVYNNVNINNYLIDFDLHKDQIISTALIYYNGSNITKDHSSLKVNVNRIIDELINNKPLFGSDLNNTLDFKKWLLNCAFGCHNEHDTIFLKEIYDMFFCGLLNNKLNSLINSNEETKHKERVIYYKRLLLFVIIWRVNKLHENIKSKNKDFEYILKLLNKTLPNVQ